MKVLITLWQALLTSYADTLTRIMILQYCWMPGINFLVEDLLSNLLLEFAIWSYDSGCDPSKQGYNPTIANYSYSHVGLPYHNPNYDNCHYKQNSQ